MAIPKRVAQRIRTAVRKFRPILQEARNADRNEQDTVTVVTDMLAQIFGYDKYSELTAQYEVRGTYCDLAVTVGGRLRFLVEVKSVDKSLKDNHLRQAADYAAKEGVQWIVLTNGVEWQIHSMIFERPVRHEHVFTLDMLSEDRDLHELIYLLTREAIKKRALADFRAQREALGRHFVAAVVGRLARLSQE